VKRLPVIIPAEVKEQIRAQVRYIARDSVDNALAWEERVRAALGALGDAHGHAVDKDASRRVGQPGKFRIHRRDAERAEKRKIGKI
jgi:hypothetical protein